MPAQNQRRRQISGRIKAEDVSGANAVQIIQGTPGVFRIFNLGKNMFIVKRASTQVNVPAKATLDLKAANITITHTAANTPVEGVYERIEPSKPIGGGRFRGKTSEGGQIVENRDGAIYRILNSGTNDFLITLAMGTTHTLKPKHSLDIVAQPTIVLSRGDDAEFECVYDAIPSVGTRTGRFRSKLKKTDKHGIISLAGSSSAAYYRILNTGDDDFQFVVSSTTGSTTGPIVKPKQSFDFLVAVGESVTVSPTVDDKWVQGVYDFVGEP